MKKLIIILTTITFLFSCASPTVEELVEDQQEIEQTDLVVETIQHLSTLTINAKSVNGIKSISYISFVDFDGDERKVETIRNYTQEHIIERNEDITIPQIFKPDLNQFLSIVEYTVIDFSNNKVEGIWEYE